MTNIVSPAAKRSKVRMEGTGNSENQAIAMQVNDFDVSFILNEPISSLKSSTKYGFANSLSKFLSTFDTSLLKEIIDFSWPDTTPAEERSRLREMNEELNFSDDYYKNQCLKKEDPELLSYTPEWFHWTIESDVTITEKEKQILKSLPDKNISLDDSETKMVLLGLVDILFGMCYNERITLGKNDELSSWTINKLSSTLSWFEVFTSVDQVVRSCVRRSLCFPIIRSWDLTVLVFEDTKKALQLGQKFIIKLFCELHQLFNNPNEPRYILNQLYINDYLIWLQKIPFTIIANLHLEIANITPQKKDAGFNLEELEQAVCTIYKEKIMAKISDDDLLEERINDLSINNMRLVDSLSVGYFDKVHDMAMEECKDDQEE